MAESELTDYSEQYFSSQSAVTLSALFVLRKWIFNYKRYRSNESSTPEDHQILTFKAELEKSVVLLKQSIFQDVNDDIKPYLFQLQIYDVCYRLHHTLLDDELELILDAIPFIDEILKHFHPDNQPDYSKHLQSLDLLIHYLDER
jgi:hypothetical protein